MSTISLSDAVETLMVHKSISRSAAKRMILKALKSGEVRATGVMRRKGPEGELLTTGQRQEIPKEFWGDD